MDLSVILRIYWHSPWTQFLFRSNYFKKIRRTVNQDFILPKNVNVVTFSQNHNYFQLRAGHEQVGNWILLSRYCWIFKDHHLWFQITQFINKALKIVCRAFECFYSWIWNQKHIESEIEWRVVFDNKEAISVQGGNPILYDIWATIVLFIFNIHNH